MSPEMGKKTADDVPQPAFSFGVKAFGVSRRRITFKFLLFVGRHVKRFVTPEFRVPGSDLWIKLKIMPTTNSSLKKRAVRFMLTKPVDDIIKVKIQKEGDDEPLSAILTSGSDSFLYEISDEGTQHGKLFYPWTVHRFEMTGIPFLPFRLSARSDDVFFVVDGQKIGIRKEILVSKSDVFKAMFDHETQEKESGVVEITDFPFVVVEQMVHFMKHGHCSLWYTELDRLTAIADKYNITGMIEVAIEKNRLMDRI